jgi:hypothetical protein
MFEKSCMKAVWITPSQACAQATRLSVSARSPQCTATPSRASAGVVARQPEHLVACVL